MIDPLCITCWVICVLRLLRSHGPQGVMFRLGSLLLPAGLLTEYLTASGNLRIKCLFLAGHGVY